MTISYPPSLTFLGDSRMQSREICVFPVYLLRGHVPCNRFSFLLHRPRIGASNSSASSFFLSFLFPPLFYANRDKDNFFSILYAGGDICLLLRRMDGPVMDYENGVLSTFRTILDARKTNLFRRLRNFYPRKRRKYRYFENVFRLEERLV